jgi:Asp-tRNA(Asn)/Glu-tRNA(Gln) amidotransferase C subunit
MRITADTVLYIAKLARLRLSADEVPKMQRDLDAILSLLDWANR